MRATRRAVLGAAGISLLGGCTSLGGLGEGREATRREFLTEPTDWEQPAHDARNSNSTEADAAPDRLAEDPTWTASFSADQVDDVSEPIVADGTVYLVLGGVERVDEFQRLVALDASTGDERWRVEKKEWATVHPPVVAEETVFWRAANRRLFALSPIDGTRRWERRSWNVHPLAAHGLVLNVGGGHRRPKLEALDLRSGTPYWRRGEGERDWSLVGADDEWFYATLHADTDEQSPELHALDPETGRTDWSTRRVAPRNAAIGSSYLFTTIGRPAAQELLALDLEDRNAEWTETHDLQRQESDQVYNGRVSASAVTDDRVLVRYEFHGSAHDRLEVREGSTGEVLWDTTGDGETPVTFSPPVVAGDTVYLVASTDPENGDRTSVLRTFDLHGGERREEVTLAESSSSHLAIADDWLFLPTWASIREVVLTAR